MTKETPILFSTDMVRALLGGRKTQTRRALKQQNIHLIDGLPSYETGKMYKTGLGTKEPEHKILPCPYGQPGDLLWVRESFQQVWTNTFREKDDDGKRIPNFHARTKIPAWGTNENYWIYRADGEVPKDPELGKFRWQTPLHIPKKAARIWLRVKNVKVERLERISEQDAIAEGVELISSDPKMRMYRNYYEPKSDGYPFANESFFSLWDKINGIGECIHNPWVWVVEFEVVSTTGKEGIKP